jgi:hypothetical protein
MLVFIYLFLELLVSAYYRLLAENWQRVYKCLGFIGIYRPVDLFTFTYISTGQNGSIFRVS